MKTLIKGLRYQIEGDQAVIYGKLLSTGKKAVFGTCHPASIPYLKKAFAQNMGLIRLAKVPGQVGNTLSV